MSTAGERALIAFEGEVECRRAALPAGLWLSGREQAAARATRGSPSPRGPDARLLLSGVVVPDALPARLTDLRASVVASESGSGGGPLVSLHARELQLTLRCRSVQLHRDVSAAFFAAVPPASVPRLERVGWSVLLRLLRLPGAAAWLMRLRGHG